MTHARLTLAALLAFAGLATSSLGQTTTWIGIGSGDWSTAINWSNGFPGPGIGAIFNTNVTVTVNGDFNTADLNLDVLGAIVAVRSGNILTVHGSSVVNNGEIQINPLNGSADAHLQFSGASCTLSGTGSIVLDPLGTQLAVDAGFETTTPTNVVINSAGHTIKGNGYMPAGISNFGLITADSPARQLNLSANPKSNAGTIIASSGGTLHFFNCAVGQTPTGVIRATGANSSVFVGNTCTVSGGTLEGVDGGVAQTSGSPTLDAVTTNGSVHVISGHALTIANALTNTGTITINPSGGAADASISFNSPAITLAGTGTIVLNPIGTASGQDAGINSSLPANIVTNPAGATIRGNGYINANINNQGLLAADINARHISLITNPKSNSGLMLAQNGGTLDIGNIAISQSSGGVVRADGTNSVVEASGSISGGTLESVNDGLVRTGGTLALDAVTTNGSVHVISGHALTIANAITNSGTITVNPTGGAADATVTFSSPATTLAGGGTIVLNPVGTSSGNDAGINTTLAANVVTNPAGATIRGNGYINANINNEGTLAADIPLRGIALVTNPKSNSGSMLAQNGGTLDIGNIAISQSSGGVVRADGTSSVVEASGSINGGTLESVNDGLVRTGGTLALDAVTTNGFVHVISGHTLTIANALTNSGTITVNPTGGAANATVVIPSSLSITGPGTVVLNGIGSLNDANFSGDVGVTLTNGPGHALAGNGELNVAVSNAGILSPGQPVTGDRTQELRRSGDLSCTPTSVVHIDLEGAAAGEFDRLTAGNNQSDFVCDGTLVVTHINGYTGSPAGTTFDVITAVAPAAVAGTFDTVTTPMIPGGFRYVVQYLPTAVRLRVVCPVDLDDDGAFPGGTPNGGVDINDLLYFLAAFEAGDVGADLDDGTSSGVPSGGVDINDLLFFLAHFEGGC